MTDRQTEIPGLKKSELEKKCKVVVREWERLKKRNEALLAAQQQAAIELKKIGKTSITIKNSQGKNVIISLRTSTQKEKVAVKYEE